MISNITYCLKKQLLILIALASSFAVAQTPVTYTPNPTNAQINTAIIGSNITITGGTLNNGDRNLQIATFTNGNAAALEMNSGAFFGTGEVANLLSLNNRVANSDNPTGALYSDPDLITLDNTATRNVVSYSFTVTLGPKASTLNVKYQFGSEEYPDYVGSIFDDAFGFFVTGPGITGTANLGRLPNGNATTINKVNYGVPGFQSPATPVSAYDGSQSALYINNGHPTTISGGKLVQNDNSGPKPVAVQFNGITKLITYTLSGLTPGGTYTFKIVIGDAGDRNYDSGLFINTIYGTATLVANNDSYTVVSGSNTTTSVLNNDSVNSTSPALLSDVILSQVSTTNSGVNLNPSTGLIDVAPGTPAGTYTVTYQICDQTFPSNCKTATATINVLINDYDNDGVDNFYDLDDDNDGILDTVECVSYFANNYTAAAAGVATDGTRSTTLSITPDTANTSGYSSTTPTYANANNTLEINYPSNTTASPDKYAFTVNTSGTTIGYNTQIRLYQVNNNATATGNNEASTYTITWTGGTGNAKFYDPKTPAVVSDYRYGTPASFDLNNGQIEGINSAGEVTNGGSFVVYNVYNNAAKWYLDFPIGASNIKITKVVLAGATQTAVDQATLNALPFTAGKDANYPNYGRLSTINSGESFAEFNAVQVLFVPDTDGDGIIDCLDLDSDGDGCFDAIEGDENVNSSQLNGNGSINYAATGGLGNIAGVNLGVPNLVNSGGAADLGADVGQGNPNAINPSISTCYIDAQNDINTTNKGEPIKGDLINNDKYNDAVNIVSGTYFDSGGNLATLPIGTFVDIYTSTGILKGSIRVLDTGRYDFTPSGTYVGDVVINYTLQNAAGYADTAQLVIKVVDKIKSTSNDSPIANQDTAYSEINTTVSSNVLHNDSDPEGNALTVTATSLASGLGVAQTVSGVDSNGAIVANAGSLTLNADGTYTFVPVAGFVGNVDPVSYTISDGNGGTNTANLNIVITPNFGNSVFANDDAKAAPQNTNITANAATGVLANDKDPENNTFSVTSASAVNASQTSSSSIALTIGTEATIPNAGKLTLNSDGSYTFIPFDYFVGTVNVAYTICDNGSPAVCDTATLHLTSISTPIIDAQNDINQIPAGLSATGNVLTNDSATNTTFISMQSANYFADSSGTVASLTFGTPTTIYDASGVLAGSITLNNTGTYTFTPAAGYVGTAPINYTVRTDIGYTDSASLTIKVVPLATAANDKPIAQDDTASTEINTNVTSNVLANDTDPDGNFLTATSTAAITIGSPTQVSGISATGNVVANAGTLTLLATGSYIFVPATDFVGHVNPVLYGISDGNGGTDTATLSITVLYNTSNDTFANDDANSAPRGTSMNGSVLNNDTDPEGNTLSVSSAKYYDNTGTLQNLTLGGTGTDIHTSTGALAGHLTLNSNGSYSFVPAPSFVGTVDIPYTMCDNGSPSSCDTATLYLTNLELPFLDAQNDINQVPSGVTALGNVITNDSTIDNSAITVLSANYVDSSGNFTPMTILGSPYPVYTVGGGVKAGDLTLNTDGSYNFVPASGFTGTFPISYVAQNASGNTDAATLEIEVMPAVVSGNDKPVAHNDTASTEINTTVSSSVLYNDIDIDGNTLTVSSSAVIIGVPTSVIGVNTQGVNVTAGNLTLNADGTYTFVPAVGFVGYVFPINYTINDGNGGTDTANLSITVLPNVGNQVFANDDAKAAPKGATITTNAASGVLANDTDPEGNNKTVSLAYANGVGLFIGSVNTIPGVGEITLNSDGSYIFNPLPTFVGTLNVRYAVCDDAAPTNSCDIATLYLTTLDYLLDAQNDINQANVGQFIKGDLLSNDTYIGGGTVSAGTYYDSAGNLQSLPLNNTYVNVYNGGVFAGQFKLLTDGKYEFIPSGNYVGDAIINYTLQNTYGATDTAQLVIKVEGKFNNSANNIPIANQDTAYSEINTTVSSNVLFNDSDPEGNALSVTGTSLASGLGVAQTVSGVDSNGAIVANAGSLTLNADGTYTFVPTAGFVGNIDPVSYTISDGNGGTNTANLNIVITQNLGNSVFANDDAKAAPQNTTITANAATGVLANDKDPESNTFSVTSATAIIGSETSSSAVVITIGTETTIPNAGKLTLNSDGSYNFIPNDNFVGTLDVTYTICDSGVTPQACDTAHLYLTSINVPILDAQNDINQVPSGVTATGNILTNDSLNVSIFDNSSIIIQSAKYLNASLVSTTLPFNTPTVIYDVLQVAAGTITLNSNGSYTFVPTVGYKGTVPIDYIATISSGTTDSAILTIEVLPEPIAANDRPIAQDDTASTEINTTVSSNLLTNDSDIDGNTLTVTSALIPLATPTPVSGKTATGVSVPNAGNLTINANGSYTFEPATGFVGHVNPVYYVISDGNGGIDSAYLDITVLHNSGNDTFANDDANTAPKGTTMNGSVLSNDTDPEGNTQSVSSAKYFDNTGTQQTLSTGTPTDIHTSTGTLVGNFTLNSDGTYTFVPAPSFVGTVDIPYIICDNGSPSSCDIATLYLTNLGSSACYKPANTTGTTLNTNHGISALGRAGADNSNWPMVRKGAWTVLEAKTKGFVVNRLTDAEISAIPAANLVEGMMVYNITQDCLQININGTATGWKCFNNQTCPD